MKSATRKWLIHKQKLAEWTGLEPATPGVTGRYSNQLNYHSAVAGPFELALRAAPSLAPTCVGDP